ncbi:ATP-binding cassette sub-family C member 4-like [Schistocerca americana]|uniref:ATP-binding cassette sub-family C member 4-like n=1 Tax=Schistocerca americana TaxID=7009 RepID=UPI001F4F6966|nr:ATP-binding cassette sub-family C member 4-like [Schistocerca americana]
MDAGKKRSRANPRQTANPLSALLFWWTIPLFREGYSHDLTVDDLYEPLKDDRSEQLGDILEAQWNKQQKKKKPSLMSAIGGAFFWQYTQLGLLVLVNDVIVRLVQPLMLGYLLAYFTPPRTMSKESAMAYAGAIVLCTAFNTLFFNHYTLGAFHAGMRVRAACCSLIYRKSLRLSRTALGETAAGQVVNLLSNDVSRFDLVSVFIHHMWAAPLTAIICMYFLYNEIGVAGFVGVAVVFVVVPIQAYTGKLSAIFRRRTAFKTDERVRLTDEIISGIQVIKMYAWEKPFSKMIEAARRAELKVVIKTSYIRGIFMTFNLCTTRLALCCTLITYVMLGSDLTADKVFVVLTYFNILAQTMSMMFVRGVAEIAEALVSVKRLQTFLMNEEYVMNTSKLSIVQNGVSHDYDKEEKEEEEAVIMESVTAKWVDTLSENTLEDVNLRVHQGQLVGVVGLVGAGKSSLLQALLGELPVKEGICKINGKVSYACQDPWVFAATIRQNIVFGRPYDRRRYKEVIRVCALQRDLELLPQGDLTVVGERGTSLSGGQKARVNLARAVYHDADIYLFDDPLSAVDTHVGKHLFDECIINFLRNKTRILVTHQLQYLSEANHVVLINNGKVEAQGGYAALTRQPQYSAMLGAAEGDEGGEERPEAERAHHGITRQLSRTSIKSKTSRHGSILEEEEEEEEAAAPDMMEATTKGVVKTSPYIGYFSSGTNYFVLFILMLMFICAQGLASGADYYISYWTTQEEARLARIIEMQNNNGTTDGGNILVISSEDGVNIQGIDNILDTDTYIFIYIGIIAALFLIAFTRSFVFYNICMSCSKQLHNTMFKNLLRTPMRFFNLNPSGRILNRFSKDMGAIDELLPKAILDAAQIIMLVLGSLIVAVSVNWVYILPIVAMGALFWFVRKVYLRASKNIKRLEGMTKSPVFTHLLATLQGLTTIRAYGAQNILKEEFDKHQDLHTAAWYMFLTTSQAFGFSLDIMCLIYITFITYSFLFLEDLFGGQIGLALTQSMGLTGMIQWGMRQSAEVANQMMAVERVMEYTALEEEPLLESTPDKRPPSSWPSKGEIQFRRTYLRYGPQSDPVLVDLNFVIRPAEKVGIVGRTGAGKSSLISALFRLAIVEGEILIDDVDTANIGLQDLRAKISIIPQDPVLFAGTLRFNLDPFGEFPDYILWRVLDDVELRDSLHDSLGLDTRVLDGGSNFSVGQRQLVCLARAILRNNRVLMLDEATANVDPHTDSLIQKTIRQKFSHCTVLTVAHRLNTIMDSDKVLVMDAGRMVEFDHPHILLQKKDGMFSKMVRQTGYLMAEQLSRIAEECYNEKVAH